MVWRLFLGSIVLAVVLLPPRASPVPPASVSAQASERVEFRKPPPSCDETIEELGLQAQPVDCKEPPPPTFDPPEMHGAYRLIPETYVGPLTYHDDPPPAFPLGVVSDDVQALKRSPLYSEPAWMPEGYVLTILRTGATGSEDALGALFEGPGQPISISWVRRYTSPVDVIVPAPGSESLLTFEAITIDGKPGILWYPKPGSPFASHLTTALSYIEDGVELTVLGEQLHPEAAKKIALSIACGAQCVSSRPSAVSAGSAATTQAARTTTGLPAIPDADPIVSPQEYLDDEHRVIAGLVLSNVTVGYHDPPGEYWHGSGYGEAALDLAHPVPDQTASTYVWFMSWPWSGTGRMHASTDDYYTYDPIYNPGGSHCTGRYVILSDAGGNYLGRLSYVHLTNQPAEGDAWWTAVGTWTYRHLGTPATWQEEGCAFYGAHLHQGEVLEQYNHIDYNTALPQQGGVINPSNDPANWMFKITLIDSDGDGCADSEETAIGFNPHNYWDVYDVPVPANPDPTPNGPKNKVVDMGDVMAVLFYAFAEATGVCGDNPNANGVDYDCDKNGDARKDGRDYDRTPGPEPNPPWDAGPPNGLIDISDVLAALAQAFVVDCSGPP